MRCSAPQNEPGSSHSTSAWPSGFFSRTRQTISGASSAPNRSTAPGRIRFPGRTIAHQHPGLASSSRRSSTRPGESARRPSNRAGITRESFITSTSPGWSWSTRSMNRPCRQAPVDRSNCINRDPSRSGAGCWAINSPGSSKSKSDTRMQGEKGKPPRKSIPTSLFSYRYSLVFQRIHGL